MPDTRLHRGPHPEDAELFAPAQWQRLRDAVQDLSWLLTKNYADSSSLKLVGDRYALTARQRQAVARCACSDKEKTRRAATRIPPEQARGRSLLVDGFNLLTTVEAAMGGGIILRARDGCTRDMASVHGSYRHVKETRPAVRKIGGIVAGLGVTGVTWYLDRPVSNSGRLRELLLRLAEEESWPWDVFLVFNPDELLAASEGIVVTSDSGILNRCPCWLDLAGMLIAEHLPGAKAIDLSL